MAKRVRKRRQAKKTGRQTNWYLIIGVIAAGVVGLFGLLFASLRTGASNPVAGNNSTFVANFCSSNDENCIEEGEEDAPITIVEISDYGCGACRNFNLNFSEPLKAQYVETGQVKWVTMPYVLRGQGGTYPTMPSAVSAMCANEQDQFSDYHLAMFESQGDSTFNTQSAFLAAAEELGMDVEVFSSCLADNEYTEIILRNISIATTAGVNSTPSFYINGRKVAGNLPRLANFQQIIDEELGS